MESIRLFCSEALIFLNNHWINHIPIHWLRLIWYRKVMKMNIGKGTSIHLGCTMDTRTQLSIGNETTINESCRIDNRAEVRIGNRVSISAQSIILTADHDVQDPAFRGRNRPVILEDYVFVGTRALIMPGVTIARGAVVAAGAVVTKDVCALDIVAGLPAKVVGKRNAEFDYSPKYRRLFH